MSDFPTSIDGSDTLPSATDSSPITNPDLATVQNNQNAAIIALENKVGTGASTPSGTTEFFMSTGTEDSAWESAATAFAALGLGSIALLSVISLTSNVTGTLPIANGGTGQTSASAALTALGGTTPAAALAAALAAVYPVGCLYTETTGTNPNTTFGFGTWSQVGEGEFLVGQKPSDPNFGTAGATGGGITHSHPLSDNGQAGIVEISNTVYHRRVSTTTYNTTEKFTVSGATGSSGSPPGPYGVGLQGNTDSQTAIPPFLVVYFWKRTA